MAVILRPARASTGRFSGRRLVLDVALAMRRLGVGASELSLSIVGDRAMRSANRRFFGRNGPTDVIAVSQVEGRVMPMPEQLLGDVIVSVDAARAQAKSCGHSLQKELAILAVHGLLHTLGMNDDTPARRAAMMRKTLSLLR